MATDPGPPNADASEWQFTLRDGLTWEDGSRVTCEDVKYGVSRTFANDVDHRRPDVPGPVPGHPANPVTDD